MQRRHERPIKRVNPSGKTVWMARYTGRDGKRKSAGTFELRGACRDPSLEPDGSAACCAQHAIDAAYDRGLRSRAPDTVGAYAETWTVRHPRSARTNDTNEGRLRAVLDVELEGVLLRDWPFANLKRRHAIALVDVMLSRQGRAAAGAQNILRTLSAMAENAIDDEIAELNPFRGVRVRTNDPRVRKAPKRIRVWSWEEMHALCSAAGRVRSGKDQPAEMDAWRPVYAEAMLRVLSDCGLRLGELLGLERRDFDGSLLHVRGNAHDGVFFEGDLETKRHVRTVPVPPELAGMLEALPARLDTRVMFPTPRGRRWMERNVYRDIWDPAKKVSGVAATPHEFRHSWTSLLRAAGVDPADLAAMAGHSVETATARYTHALGRSYDVVREAVGR